MTLTITFLNEMFRMWGDRIDKPLEKYLLSTYEEEPFPYEWSEQDLYEQIRKLIFQYNQGNLDVTIPWSGERQKLRYESLKDSYMELFRENIQLREIIQNVRSVVESSTEDSKLSLD